MRKLSRRRKRPGHYSGLFPGELITNNAVDFERHLIAAGNFWILVFVRNHPPAFFDSPKDIVIGFLMRDFESKREETAAVADRQMARRFFAGIKVLMKPIARGAVDAAFAPFDLDDLVLATVRVRMEAPLLVPEQDVADGLQPDYNGAWAVVVCLVIFSHWPLAQMADESVAGHFKLTETKPAPLTSRFSKNALEISGMKLVSQILIKPLT